MRKRLREVISCTTSSNFNGKCQENVLLAKWAIDKDIGSKDDKGVKPRELEKVEGWAQRDEAGQSENWFFAKSSVSCSTTCGDIYWVFRRAVQRSQSSTGGTPAQWISSKKDVSHKSFLACLRASSRHVCWHIWSEANGLEVSAPPACGVEISEASYLWVNFSRQLSVLKNIDSKASWSGFNLSSVLTALKPWQSYSATVCLHFLCCIVVTKGLYI